MTTHITYWTLNSALFAARTSHGGRRARSIEMIPAGAVLGLDENSSLGGMVNVVWNDVTYQVFRDDLIRLAVQQLVPDRRSSH